MRRFALLCLVALFAGCSDDGSAVVPDGGTDGASPTPPLPDGAVPDSGPGPDGGGGIASKYPGDIGIGNDPDVIFADDFESYTQASELTTKWDNYFQASQTKIVTDAANVKAGKKALELTQPQQNNELSNGVAEDPGDRARRALPALLLEVRQELRRHRIEPQRRRDLGTLLPAGTTPRRACQRTGRTSSSSSSRAGAAMASDKSPGMLNVYIYHPEQRSKYGDHFFPTGLVLPNTSIPNNFGPTFVPRAGGDRRARIAGTATR